MAQSWCLLLSAAVVYGRLIIDIDLLDNDKPLLDARGPRSAVIKNEERKIFQITDQSLKKAIAKTTHGPEPTDVYVRSKGGPFDLHKTYNWEEVKRTVKPTFKLIKDKTSCETEVQELDNNEMSVESVWKSKGNVSVDLEYIIYLNGDAKLRIKSAFGENVRDKKTFPTTRKIHVKKCDALIDLSFKINLSGRVAANYLAVRNDHHFWSYDINHVLKGAKLPTEVVINETISISYYKVMP